MLAFRETKFSRSCRQSYTRLRNGRWWISRSRRLRLSRCWKRRTDYQQNFIEEASMLHKIDTVIVGGGQAGLAISYYLTQEGREHVALERAPAVANAWRNQRWDSFTLVTPNFQVRMPGAEYDGNDPYGFMSLREVVKYFDDYV